MRDILELVIVLSIICVVAALSLAKVYDVTKEPIALQKRLARLRAVNAVLPAHDNEPDQDTISLKTEKKGDVLVYKGFYHGQLTGLAFEMTAMGFGGELGVMMGLNPNGIIQGIEITFMSETPGLGAKITNPPFKEQFRGKSLAKTRFKLKKDGGDLDQVTGASVSPRAVVKAVHEGLEFYQKHKGIITKQN